MAVFGSLIFETGWTYEYVELLEVSKALELLSYLQRRRQGSKQSGLRKKIDEVHPQQIAVEVAKELRELPPNVMDLRMQRTPKWLLQDKANLELERRPT